jgi:hypothetical protein
MLDCLINTIETPREVKRLVGAFAVLERAVRGEICPYDVLGYSWIATKAPGVRDKVAANVDELVADPSESSMLDRAARELNRNEKQTVSSVLGESAAPHAKVLNLLFPRFSGDARTDDGNRLSRRRNLVRMLYLGNPPGMFRREDLEAYWLTSDLDELEGKLRRLLSDGRLAAAIDRLDDLLPSLPEGGDRTFWLAMSRSFRRQSDWLEGPEAARALADDAAAALYRLASRSSERTPRLRTAIEALIEDGDLILTPWILRKHLFAHGITNHAGGARGGEVLNRKETESLLSRELPRYRRAVLDGTALRRLPNLEVVYALSNSGNWDDELRSDFTSQLTGLEAITTFAALIVPPGYTAERAALDELLDANVLQERTEALLAGGTGPADAWLKRSVLRLRAILAGKHPMFSTDEEEQA